MRPFIYFLILLCLVACPFAYGQVVNDPCVPSPTTLCLNNDRFEVNVDWATESGNDETVSNFSAMGDGRGTLIDDGWAGVWFFDPDNLEMIVHIFQGCGFNNNYWVFAAGLTNVEVTLTVSDTQTGETKEFFSPLGMPFEPITDTDAFATCPRQSLQSSKSPGTPPGDTVTPEALGDCVGDATHACLLDERFEVFVETLGFTSPATVLSDGTVGFPFTNPTFFDLVVTIRDGRSVNENFWVTYSSFPPVNFTLTVIDHVTDTSKVYEHVSTDPNLVQDKEAFNDGPITAIDGTHGGSWYQPARDGEGFIFDIFLIGDVPYLALYYFTYENNASGRQAWLVGFAPIIGNTASVPVTIADGAQFGAAMDPEDVNRTDWGTLKVTVSDCDNALIESSSSLFPLIRYDLVRLTPPPTSVNGLCKPASAIPAGTMINGGHGGSWYKVTRDGEGFIFDISVINGVNTLSIYYFTYENNVSGRQAFVTGTAPIVGTSADVPMFITSGTRFGDDFDPDNVVRTPWGNIRVTWQSCNLAHIEVTSTLFEDIDFSVDRLTPPAMGSPGPCGS